jgi:hypothetical protein
MAAWPVAARHSCCTGPLSRCARSEAGDRPYDVPFVTARPCHATTRAPPVDAKLPGMEWRPLGEYEAFADWSGHPHDPELLRWAEGFMGDLLAFSEPADSQCAGAEPNLLPIDWDDAAMTEYAAETRAAVFEAEAEMRAGGVARQPIASA